VSYDALGRPLSQQNTNSTTTSWSYSDPRGFLSQIQTSGPQGTIQNLQYTQYTDAGLLQQVTSPISGEGWSYAYDDLGHMTTATNLSNAADSQSFTYDGADRILTSSRYGSYSYPASGQPRPHAPVSVNGVPLSYDLNGNVTQAGTRTLTWNANDQPTQVTLGGVTTTFTYDGPGERLKKSSPLGTSYYPFGDDAEITNAVITKYVSVEGLGVIAKRVGTGPGSVTYWVHTDRLGSIQAVSDGAGQLVQRRTYRPYGETLAQAGATESRGWIDQRNDPETGLTYLHARYFDPQLGVFLSPDPIGVEGGLNLYSYAFGNPLNLTDRSGLAASHCSETSVFGPSGFSVGLTCSDVGGGSSLVESLHNWFMAIVHNLGNRPQPGERNPGGGREDNGTSTKEPAPTTTCKEGDTKCNDSTSKADPNQAANAASPNCKGPDYIAGNLAFQIPVVSTVLSSIPVVGPGLAATVGVSVQGTVDRGGNVYLGLGPAFGVPVAGFNLQAGRMLLGPNPASGVPAPPSQRTPAELSSHISGHSLNWNGTYGLSLGHTTGLTDKSGAVFGEVGVGTPGTSVSYHYTVPLFQAPALGWGECK
jgi:RHS repeat-associated protein